MTALALIEHASPGRLRLRVASRRGQADYFETVRSHLAAEPAVRAVQVDPRTGSVLLLLHAPTDTAALLRRAAQHGLFTVVAPPSAQDSPELPAPLRALGRLAEPGTAGGGLLALTLLAGAAVQGWRGQVAAPAITLTWYALQLLRGGKGSS
ncbi:hypothetical protein [Immundisolibacter sp.]|uniref:hypothetical protein n=1 Tax=Immundisolibacter sp. TaxID=1934948 RepID=UPI00260E0E0D|nr:hypothetical protein [Immundisolibacter sp.]MDD3652486.1 hypothetical protein [Immundisolibacter sp.]